MLITIDFVDDARLFQAHCVRMAERLIDREQGDDEPNRHADRDYHKWLAQNILESHIGPLLDKSREGASEEILQHLLEIFDTASKLSRQLWSQKTHISIWRHQQDELGLYPHLNDKIIKAHPGMNVESENDSIFGRKLHMLMRPAILASSIGDKNGGWKIWTCASGLIFSDGVIAKTPALSEIDLHEPRDSPDSRVGKQNGKAATNSSKDPAMEPVAHVAEPTQTTLLESVDILAASVSNTEIESPPVVKEKTRASCVTQKLESPVLDVLKSKDNRHPGRQSKGTAHPFTIDLSNDSEDDCERKLCVKLESVVVPKVASSKSKIPDAPSTAVTKVNSRKWALTQYMGGDASEVSNSMEQVLCPSPYQPTKFSNSDSHADEKQNSENGHVNSPLKDSKPQGHGQSSSSAIHESTTEEVGKQADVLAAVPDVRNN